MEQVAQHPARWLKVLDQTRCIGCHACTTACKSENEVPVGVTRTYVKSADVGTFPQARRAFQVTRCNQCTDAPCVTACPTEAMYKRPDGIVDFDKEICIGCKACMAACPYDAIFINPDDHSAEKCNMCAHRIDAGLEPACVSVCPTGAIIVGDGNDPTSKVAQLVARHPVDGPTAGEGDRTGRLLPRRAPGHPRPTRICPPRRRPLRLGHPGRARPSARHRRPPARGPVLGCRTALLRHPPPCAMGLAGQPLHVDQEHRRRRIPVGRAAGADRSARLVGRGHPLGGSGDGAGLPRHHRGVADLGSQAPVALLPDLHQAPLVELVGQGRVHHRRLRRDRRAVSGGVGARPPRRRNRFSACSGSSLGLATACYTAYLFAQAKARDLWQSPLLPAHLAVQAVLAGAAALLPFALWLSPADGVRALEVVLAVAAAVAPSARLDGDEPAARHRPRRPCHPRDGPGPLRARLHRLASSRWRSHVAAPWIGVVAVPFALIGLLAHEHAYVQAGQSVPLA